MQIKKKKSVVFIESKDWSAHLRYRKQIKAQHLAKLHAHNTGVLVALLLLLLFTVDAFKLGLSMKRRE